ncbi:MAG: hypothetical protein K1X82_08230 [Bacteroidia bacterium]|nr:hypothetical protein [Bacteroidia bacterium]
MRLPISIFLLVSILLGSVSKTWIYSHYRMNFDTYAKVLCENKNKPMLHCNGKCQLKKELNQQESKETQSIPVESNIDLFFQYSEPSLFFHETPTNSLIKQTVPSLLSGAFLSVFQPPEA